VRIHQKAVTPAWNSGSLSKFSPKTSIDLQHRFLQRGRYGVEGSDMEKLSAVSDQQSATTVGPVMKRLTADC
jgi:hypothetical protein